MKLTKRKLSILALALILVLALSVFFSINTFTAEAKGTVTVINSTTVFYPSSEGATVSSDTLDEVPEEDEEDESKKPQYYTTFNLTSEKGSVAYRRNLAYFWKQPFTEEVEGEDGETQTVTTGYSDGLFNMEIGFKGLSFEKFIITFESQQYNKTENSKSSNYIIFFPASNSKVNVLITDDKEEELEEGKTYPSLNSDKIKIHFIGRIGENISVRVENEGGVQIDGELENVGGNYAKSSTSSSSPLYPLIFSATFAEDEEDSKAQMLLYSLNNQTFEMTSSTATTVTDNAPPVLCMEESFKHFSLGDSIDPSFVVIDVLRTSPTSTVYYYVLTCDQYDTLTDFNDKSLFTELNSDVKLESDWDKYRPEAEDLAGTIYNKYDADGTLKADMLVKVYILLSDYSTESYKETAEVYLDWYVDRDDSLVTLFKNSDKEAKFIAVADDELGATYNYNGDGAKSWQELIEEYQAQVDKLAANLSAGSSSYFYLPSAEKLFSDNDTAYTDLKLSIYYYHDTQSSNTNLATNNLSINITKQGDYIFTIYATDASGNSMYYINEDGEITEFAASEIWSMFDDQEGGLYEKLPWFSFYVSYKGVSFEETPGMQSTAYVGTTYTSASFKINGVSGMYETKYRLFTFDRAAFYNATGISYSYEQFIDVMDALFNNEYFTDEVLGDKLNTLTGEELANYRNTRKYFNEIPVVSSGDADYEEYKDYGWSSTSTSFTPQEGDKNAFFYIRAEVTDTLYNTDPVTCGLAVVVSENAKTLSGEDDWLERNVASVVLLSVAGVAFIGIVLLLLIRPKNKEDIDVQFEKKTKKSRKSKN